MGKVVEVLNMRKFQAIWPENSWTNVWTLDEEFTDMLDKCGIEYVIRDEVKSEDILRGHMKGEQK